MRDTGGRDCRPSTASRLQVQVISNAESRRLVVLGEVDLATADQFEQEVVGRLDSGRSRLVLDLSHLSFMDVAGARALMRSHQRASEIGTSFQLIPGEREPRRVLELCGWLEAFDDLDEQSV